MNLEQIKRRTNISGEAFLNTYYIFNCPVILTNHRGGWSDMCRGETRYLAQANSMFEVPMIDSAFYNTRRADEIHGTSVKSDNYPQTYNRTGF